jgi:hypothetical protein
MSKHKEDELNTNIRQNLDESVDALDANTLSKIRQIRAQAVEKAEVRHVNWPPNRQGFLVGSLVTACIMVFAVIILLKSPTPMQTVPIDDIELISSADSLELFEDLEFYEWLEEDGLPS